MNNSPAVRCDQLGKSFGSVCAVLDASFHLDRGVFMALLGPSGCGKTTILRMIAGLEQPDSGEISIGEKVVAASGVFIPPNRRNVGMVFQDYALFPHMTVEKNIGYGLSRTDKTRIEDMLSLVGLSGLEKRYPGELSGGQQQRVALARALAPQPDILLLDEPFSNLDTALRGQVREDVRQIIKAAGVSAILVTHDQDEAMSMADQIGVMLGGRVVQVGSPRDLYEHPLSAAIALFMGEANQLRGEASGETVNTALGILPLMQAHQGSLEVLIRPENIVISDAGIAATVESYSYVGHRQTVTARLADGTVLKISTHPSQRVETGATIYLRVMGEVMAFTRVS